MNVLCAYSSIVFKSNATDTLYKMVSQQYGVDDDMRAIFFHNVEKQLKSMSGILYVVSDLSIHIVFKDFKHSWVDSSEIVLCGEII